jgi:hypothetical protein
VFVNAVEAPPIALERYPTWRGIVEVLEEQLLNHASWFVRIQEVVSSKWRASSVNYELVHLSSLDISDPALTACIRSLLANSDSVRAT